MNSPFDSILFLVYFIYGLAFFGLGIALAVESGRSPALVDAKIIRPLAIFGLLHGTHEWLEAYLMQSEAYGAELPGWLPWIRLFLLISSFIFLIIFGSQAFLLHARKIRIGGYLLLGFLLFYILFILVNAIYSIRTANNSWFDLLNVLSRYILAVPGAILAAMRSEISGNRVSG